MRTIIAKEQDKRTIEIFQSNLDIKFAFLPVFKYTTLPIESKWLENFKNGYFNWIIFTSFRSWQILMGQIAESIVSIPNQTKIAVFGPASVAQIKQCRGRVDFTTHAHNAFDFGLKFVDQLSPIEKIAYPASLESSTQIEKSLSINDICVFRENIYKPECIIEHEKISEIMDNFNPDSMVFFSCKSVKSFMDKCSVDILNEIGKMQLFALGNPTSKVLREYSINKIIKPKYPDIYMLSDLINEISVTQGNRSYVITKAE